MGNVSPSSQMNHTDSLNTLSTLIEHRMHELLVPEASGAPVSNQITYQSIALDAAAYHLRTGGQRMRSKLCIQAGLSLGLSTENIVSLGAACELIHNASLIHDDIQDRDEYRRGKKTVWAIYGQGVGICTGDLFISAAYLSLSNIDQRELIGTLIKKTHDRIATVIYGQCADLALKDQLLNDINLYQQIVVAKSGALIGLPLELCLISARMPEWLPNIAAVVEPFAIGYQILDDLKDLDEDAKSDTKQQSLNAILVLEQLQGSQNKIDAAKQLAVQKFHEAAKSAKLLPQNLGGQLAELAFYLADQV